MHSVYEINLNILFVAILIGWIKVIVLVMCWFVCCKDSKSTLKHFSGKKRKGTRRYMPQRNSVAYALIITLYR